MYIAIEGIKGSGKSTIINQLINDFSKEGINPEIFPITAPMELTHPMEIKVLKECKISQSDSFIEKLFLCRAYWHQQKINKKAPIIIGDRSIATACVTRWKKWGDPDYTCKRVKWQYAGIIKPEIIVWLDTSVDLAIHNISKRVQKSTGKSDETIEKIMESQIAYSQLFFGKQYEKNFGSVEVVSIKNDGDIEQVINNIKKVINKKSH